MPFDLPLGSTRFRDSFRLVSTALHKIPDEYGLSEELQIRKGYFPHTFNTLDRYLEPYIGPLPPRDYFQPERFDKRDDKKPREHSRESFEEWYAERSASNESWDLRKEMEAYCWDDVKVLRELLIKLYTDAADLNIINPLTCTTRAGVAFRTYRQNYMPENSIGILRCKPSLVDQKGQGADEDTLCRSGYSGGKTMTSCVLCELTEEEQERGDVIVMDDVVSMYPDAMLENRFPTGDFVYREWLNSMKHDELLHTIIHEEEGFLCGELYYPSASPPLIHPVLPSRRKNNPDKRSDPSKLVFSLDLPPVSEDDIRHWESHHSDILRYLKHDLTCTSDRCATCDEIDAFKCACFKVHPRVFGKERPVYAMPLVRYALEMGYQIRSVYWTLSTPDYRTDLFTDYVKQFYRVKHKYKKVKDKLKEDLRDPEFAAKYAKDHFIDLEDGGTLEDYHDPRPGRSVEGKLMLNTLYGRFALKGGKVEMFNSLGQEDEEALWEKFQTGELIFKDQAVHQNVTVYRASAPDQSSSIASTAVYLAAYVTAYAQIKLNRKLNLHGFNAFYCDTDSCVIRYRGDEEQAPTGSLLGNWEREDKVGNCHAFVSIGQKIYALKSWVPLSTTEQSVVLEKLGVSLEELEDVDADIRREALAALSEGVFGWRKGKLVKEKTVKLKVKGVSMKTDDNSELLTYESMKRMAQTMLGIGDGRSAALKDERFTWNRELSRFFIEKGQKIITASTDQLKGDLGGPDGTYVMPWGWKRFKWGFETEEQFEERLREKGWTRESLDNLTPDQLK